MVNRHPPLPPVDHRTLPGRTDHEAFSPFQQRLQQPFTVSSPVDRPDAVPRMDSNPVYPLEDFRILTHKILRSRREQFLIQRRDLASFHFSRRHTQQPVAGVYLAFAAVPD